MALQQQLSDKDTDLASHKERLTRKKDEIRPAQNEHSQLQKDSDMSCCAHADVASVAEKELKG